IVMPVMIGLVSEMMPRITARMPRISTSHHTRLKMDTVSLSAEILIFLSDITVTPLFVSKFHSDRASCLWIVFLWSRGFHYDVAHDDSALPEGCRYCGECCIAIDRMLYHRRFSTDHASDAGTYLCLR